MKKKNAHFFSIVMTLFHQTGRYIMMVETVLARSVRLICAGGLALGMHAAWAQTSAEPEHIARVEITGSSIKRIAKEGSLPVQTLTRADIEQSGASNVADLVAQLPSMQGFITSSTSVNGGGNGVQTASIHAIGTQYAGAAERPPHGTVWHGQRRQSGQHPAVRRRARGNSDRWRLHSVRLGRDCRRGQLHPEKIIRICPSKALSMRRKSPVAAQQQHLHPKGWGDLENDGYNVLLAYSHDQQKELNAKQRDFAKTGAHPFTHNGKKYVTWQTSINSTPANVEVVTANDDWC
jgi:iron complex outermembrane receptor protein